ncbi:MAG: hydrogenase nickel incorporation protein HypB [Steroidobacteraceae bacterium]
MCESCGCGLTLGEDFVPHTSPLLHHGGHREHISVLTQLRAQNDATARHNRAHLDEHGVLAINLMSSPGAGKTTLLEQTIERLGARFRIAVIEGDLATDNDARRIRATGVQAIQITTGNACHLDASMLHRALHEISLPELDLLFIENVGNLVCPASFDLGQHRNVVLLSVPEGDDKPEKYPVMFRAAELLLITKTDLLEHIPEFDPRRARHSLRSIAIDPPVIELSCRRGTGLDTWCEWLEKEKHASDARRAVHAGSGVAHEGSRSEPTNVDVRENALR